MSILCYDRSRMVKWLSFVMYFAFHMQAMAIVVPFIEILKDKVRWTPTGRCKMATLTLSHLPLS